MQTRDNACTLHHARPRTSVMGEVYPSYVKVKGKGYNIHRQEGDAQPTHTDNT